MGALRLTAADAAKYSTDGYVLYHEPVFAAVKFQRLTSIFEELLAGIGGARTDTLDTPHFRDARLLEFLLDDRVLDLVEPLIGPDIGLWSSHFISKEPRIGRATPWHKDADYWESRFDNFTGIVTIWLAIDRSDKGNGCMRVIPGSHHAKSGEYVPVDAQTNTFETQLANVDETRAVYFELSPNTCSLHDSRLVHGAAANTSERRRCGYTMRYFSQQMRYLTEAPGNLKHHLWHARGKNPHNNPVRN
jgi:ectoine hydroxylase-related dioxygenase (phytanoyl-CoA dioxygenase family)